MDNNASAPQANDELIEALQSKLVEFQTALDLDLVDAEDEHNHQEHMEYLEDELKLAQGVPLAEVFPFLPITGEAPGTAPPAVADLSNPAEATKWDAAERADWNRLTTDHRTNTTELRDGDAEAWGVPDGTPTSELPATHEEWLEEGPESPLAEDNSMIKTATAVSAARNAVAELKADTSADYTSNYTTNDAGVDAATNDDGLALE